MRGMSPTFPAARRSPEGDLEGRFRAELAQAEPPAFEELAAFVDGTLEPAEEEALASWMAADAGLAAEVADLASLRAELAAAGRLREPRTDSAALRLPRRYLAAAATLALALGGSWLATRSGRPVRPDAAAPVDVAVAVSPAAQVQPAASLPDASVGLAGGPGSFESGTLQGWQTPSTRFDFEDGRIDAPVGGSGA